MNDLSKKKTGVNLKLSNDLSTDGKQLIQSLISNWVEPLSTISWLIGNDYNEGFINLVWKNLLR